MKFKELATLIKQTYKEWSEDKAPRLAAALAYYTAFSLAPILVIVIAIVGIFLERQAVQETVVQQVSALAGPNGEELITNMLTASQNIGNNTLAIIIGVGALLLGASGVFGQLQDAMNTMWEVQPKPSQGIWGLLKSRFLNFSMVIILAFLLLVSLLVSASLSALSSWTLGLFPGFEIIVQALNFVVSLLVITVIFALIFKFVPDAKIAWKDVWLGAAVTALLFTLGKFLIGLYLGNASIADQFGAAGSLVVLLVWVYYSAQISFFGAEFTQVYANMFGSRIRPEEGAVPMTEEARQQQGMPHKAEEQAFPQRRQPGEPGLHPIPVTAVIRREPPIEVRVNTKEYVVLEDKPIRTLAGVILALISITTGYILGVFGGSGHSRNRFNK